MAWGIAAFVVAAAIAGQMLMHGQGDTPAISVRYGLLYVTTGCGIPEIPKMIRLG